MSMPIPASHLDLFTRPIHGVLATMMPDGQPQSSLVWYDYDGKHVSVNTTRERRKGRNMLDDPRVSLLVVDPEDTSRYVKIRGDVEMILDIEGENLDQLTRKYTRYPHYYGYIYPLEQKERVCIIHATKITLDAIHKQIPH